MKEHCARYPETMMQNMHCHIRALWNLSQEAAAEALQKSSELNYCLKTLHHFNKDKYFVCTRVNLPNATGCASRLTCTSTTHIKIKDYDLVIAILCYLERSGKYFGKEYSTTTTRVKEKDLVEGGCNPKCASNIHQIIYPKLTYYTF